MRSPRNRGAWRAARLWPLALALLAAPGPDVTAQNASPATQEGAKAQATFPPEVEEKLTEYFKKAAEVKRRFWRERIQKEVEEVVKITGLDAERTKTLEAAAQTAADRSVARWSARLNDLWRRQWQVNAQPKQLLLVLNQLLPQVEATAKEDFFGDYVRPEEDPAWIETVRRTLTAEQAAAWQQAQTARRRVLEKEIGEFLKPNVERTREQFGVPTLAKVAELKSALALSKERAEQLDALAQKATAESVETWRKTAERNLLFASEEQRRQILKQGQFYFGLEEKDLPLQQAVWKEGLAKLLTPEEQARLEAAKQEHTARRIRVLGQVLLAELDEKVAFTVGQRQRLRPIAERLVQDQPLLFPQDHSDNYRNVPLQAFFVAAAKAAEEEMKSILDPIQWKHWQETCAKGILLAESGKLAEAKSNPTANQPEPEPEELERSFSDFLFEKSTSKREELLAPMMLKTEDAARVVKLAAEPISRLQTAARGAAEETLTLWKSQTEQMVRANLNDVTAGNARRRLASLEDYTFRQRIGKAPEKQPIWERTVHSELTAEQQAVWQKEVDERRDYRDKTIAAAIMAEFDQKIVLTAEQWEKIEPKVARIIGDYSPDIANFFTYSDGGPWYLQYYLKFIPFAGVPENDLKTVLTKEQWDRWAGCNEFSNCLSYWANLQQNHQQRLKQAK